MRISSRKRAAAGIRILKGLAQGYRYAFRAAPIRSLLIHLGIISFLSMPYTVLMPYFARDYLHGGPDTLGVLMASSGCGAIIGTVSLASRNTIRGLSRVIVAASYWGRHDRLCLSKILTVSIILLFFADSTDRADGFQQHDSATIVRRYARKGDELYAMAFAEWPLSGASWQGPSPRGSAPRKPLPSAE